MKEPLRFLVWGRAVPAALFGFLGWLILQRLIASMGVLGRRPAVLDVIGGPVRHGLYFLFCAIPVILVLTRPMPRARDGRLLSRAAALAGTTMLLAAGAFVPPGPLLGDPPRGAETISTLLLVVMEALALYGLICLRRNFSIMPEARQLVVRGPYRLIRHPLYAAEIGTAIAVVLPAPRLWSILLLVAFIAIQVYRSTLEEGLLCRELPDYEEYRRRTRRLVPLIW